MKEFGWTWQEYRNTPGPVIDAMSVIISTRNKEEEKMRKKAARKAKQQHAKHTPRHVRRH